MLGGRSVPVSLLAELADDLVARHGQNDGAAAAGEAASALDRYTREAPQPLGRRAAYEQLGNWTTSRQQHPGPANARRRIC